MSGSNPINTVEEAHKAMRFLNNFPEFRDFSGLLTGKELLEKFIERATHRKEEREIESRALTEEAIVVAHELIDYESGRPRNTEPEPMGNPIRLTDGSIIQTDPSSGYVSYHDGREFTSKDG